MIKLTKYLVFFSFIVIGVFADSGFLRQPKTAKGFISQEGSIALAAKFQDPMQQPVFFPKNNIWSVSASYQRMNQLFYLANVFAGYRLATDLSIGFFASYLGSSIDDAVIENYQATSQTLTIQDMELGVNGTYRLNDHFLLGANLRYFRLQLNNAIANSFNSDLGITYLSTFRWSYFHNLRLSAALRNLGPSFSYSSSTTSEPLLATPTLGASIQLKKWVTVFYGASYSKQFGLSNSFGSIFLA